VSGFSNTLLGKVGFGVSQEIIKNLCYKVSAYAVLNLYNNIVIGYNGSNWSKEFYNEIIKNLNELSRDLTVIDRPSTLYETCWLASELKSQSLVLYITETMQGSDYISISLFKKDLAPLNLIELDNLKLEQSTAGAGYKGNTDTVTIKGLLKYLQDSKIVSLKDVNKFNLCLDSMFGAGEYFFKELNQQKLINVSFFNPQSSPTRIVNYTSNPTGQFLSNYAKVCLNPDFKNIFFGIGPDGEKIGLYDLKQDTEINSSSIIVLLAYYYAKIKKRKGTVILTSITGSKTLEVINKLNLSYEIVDCGPQSFYESIHKKRKRPVLFYANEYGNIWFKGDISACNNALTILTIINLCKEMSRSTGEILDIINTSFLENNYLNFNYAVIKDVLSVKDFEFILKEHIVDKKNYINSSVYLLNNSARLALKDNLNYNRLEISVESTNQEDLKNIAIFLQEEISKKCLESYV
jgi:phosphomannomutase